MIRKDFEGALRRLLNAAQRYYDTPRNPDDIATLGAARINLEDARVAVAAARPRVAPTIERGAMLRSFMDDDKAAEIHLRTVGLTSG